MTTPTLVIGAIPSAGAAAALHAAGTLAAAMGDVHLVLAHASPEAPDGSTEATIRDWYRHEVGTDRSPTIECRSGEPAEALLATAETHDALLVAVGAHRGRHAWPRHRLGHTVATLLDLTDRPLMICPASTDQPATPHRELLVGFDDTPASHAALAFARRLGDHIDGSVHAVTVVDLETLAESAAAAQHRMQVAAERALERLDAAVAETPGRARVTTGTRYGRPQTTLLELGATADLLVLGDKRRGPISRAVVGSTTRSCILRATKPVIVVPPTDTTANPA